MIAVTFELWSNPSMQWLGAGSFACVLSSREPSSKRSG